MRLVQPIRGRWRTADRRRVELAPTGRGVIAARSHTTVDRAGISGVLAGRRGQQRGAAGLPDVSRVRLVSLPTNESTVPGKRVKRGELTAVASEQEGPVRFGFASQGQAIERIDHRPDVAGCAFMSSATGHVCIECVVHAENRCSEKGLTGSHNRENMCSYARARFPRKPRSMYRREGSGWSFFPFQRTRDDHGLRR